MVFKKPAKVGYVPHSPDFEHPGDKRRFAYYARRRGIPFEIADPAKSYDLVVVTQNADLGLWVRHAKSRIIFDLPDSYLSVARTDPKGLLRGLAKYVGGKTRYLQLDYWKTLQDICRRADAVACSTEAQRRDILPFCRSVHPILDFHMMCEGTVKQDYARKEVFNLVWEGLPTNLHCFSVIREVLRTLSARHRLALHLVTNLDYHRYMGLYGRRHSIDEVRRIFQPAYLYEWSETFLPVIATACDLAVIPLPLDNPLACAKPSNKLLLFWRMGVPAVTSATPAYLATMSEARLPMACRTEDEWLKMLEHYIADEQARKDAGQLGRAYVQQHSSEEAALLAWDRLLEAALASKATDA